MDLVAWDRDLLPEWTLPRKCPVQCRVLGPSARGEYELADRVQHHLLSISIWGRHYYYHPPNNNNNKRTTPMKSPDKFWTCENDGKRPHFTNEDR